MTDRITPLADSVLADPVRPPDRPVDRMTIRAEPAKALSAQQECEIVRAAVARNPASPELRLRLAKLLNRLDAFDAAIDVLTAPEPGAKAAPLDIDAWRTLAMARFARDAPGDLALAAQASAQAVALAATDDERSAALADEARALLLLDRRDDARARLTEALRLDPTNMDACRRLATDLLHCGEAEGALVLADRLMAQGVRHTRLLAVRTLALVRLDRIDEARATLDPGGFRHIETLQPPPGWDSLAAFNAALADELGRHPGIRYGRHGTASRETWRIDALATGAAPLARALLAQIASAAERHVASLGPSMHPWLASRPAAGVLRSWCVMTDSEGFERWHAHPAGWMSGVYYVQVPGAVVDGSDRGGCIAFGVPDGTVGARSGERFGEELVRPRPGMLMLFPSHSYHRTYPHGTTDRRICVSFDILPA